MKKSTIETSRKIHAMNTAFKMLGFLMCLYIFMAAFELNPSEMIFGAAIAAIGAIVSALNIADGMKGHESDYDG
jgi:uncharacterized membrane protein